MDSITQNFKQVPLLATSQSVNAEAKLAEYQRNMKIFIQSVEKQMASIIDRYQDQIKKLKSQIDKLKNQIGRKNLTATGFGLGLGLQSQLSQCFSPIKYKRGSLTGIETARSNFLEELPIKNFFDSESKYVRTDSKIPNFDFKLESVESPQKLNKSRFEIQTKKKRQRQQDLLHFLEMGKSNLDLNTDKMFSLIGKSKKDNKKDEQNEEVVQVDSPTKKKKAGQAHNTSLNSICDSLNNSFHGKKAQQKSQKKRKQLQTKQQQQARKQEQRQKFKKEQGIKNLLTTMRKNISSSMDRPAQIIKGSKLLTTGEKVKSIKQSSKGKVMINPVAVDLSQRNKEKQHNSVTTSPSKNPQSILKNSSTNFLTKSIQNISAISFYSSGEE